MSSGQQLSIRGARAACRSLFGAVDHEELNRDIEAKLRELSEQDQKRWNFNFVTGTPLLGDYEWEGAAGEATPAFYQESVQVGKRRAVAPHVKPHTEAPDRENRAREDAAGGTVSPESASAGKQSRTRRRARAHLASTPRLITDFYVKRKKLGGDLKRRESATQNNFYSLSCERTPHKLLR
ncbi:cyclin-dependent kinase inhibitor 1C-like [Neoarius graeffei]|uniref:cyclin-dependent kinase inhibitor 1C-like n=1 Tax=Neoarius graeffei TaxID=443677 RepID=UPI00298BE63F|nr:cyclin-dependent kinase inhibitor 1C-like [Neoarius graeffei]